MVRPDAELVARTLGGDKDAFRLLVLRYTNATHALIYATLGTYREAEDLAQEAFLRAFQHLDSLRRHDRFGPWLYGITRNVCLAWLRKQGEPPVSLDDVLVEHLAAGDPVSSGPLERHERRRQVMQAVEALPLKYRKVVALRYLADMSIEHIAATLSVSRSAVHARLSRAREMLRKRLAPVEAEPTAARQWLPHAAVEVF